MIRELSEMEVKHIRYLHKVLNHTYEMIGKKLALSPDAVSMVVRRKTYAWIK